MVLFVLACAVRCVCCSRVVDTGLLACEGPVGGDVPRGSEDLRLRCPLLVPGGPDVLSRERGLTRHQPHISGSKRKSRRSGDGRQQ